MKIISLFCGGGGLDLGFRRAGFEIIWANDFDKSVMETYRRNHGDGNDGGAIDVRNLVKIPSNEIPDADGIIGSPPCQSWSAAGNNLGLDDKRGQIFLEYLRVINDKRPKFFVIENVEGILRKTHSKTLANILLLLGKCGSGYNIKYKLLDAADYGVPQNRLRVFFVGIRLDLPVEYFFPDELDQKITLKDAIWDLRDLAEPHDSGSEINDHMYLNSGWSSQFMSRNRVRRWDEQAFTIPASGRHVTLHPQAPVMKRVSPDLFKFVEGSEELYRRFTLRECARIQTFPDSFQLVVNNVNQGYKVIGNAVPVNLAYCVAKSVKDRF